MVYHGNSNERMIVMGVHRNFIGLFQWMDFVGDYLGSMDGLFGHDIRKLPYGGKLENTAVGANTRSRV